MAESFNGFSKEWLKIKQYCDKAERCHQDVQSKLRKWELPHSVSQLMVVQLIGEKLLNEERYARAYAYDHHEFKRWGNKKSSRVYFVKVFRKL